MWPFKRNPQKTPYSALVDSSSSILLSLNTNFPVTTFLAQAMSDTFTLYNVNFHHPDRPFPLEKARPEAYPMWTWSVPRRQFVRTRSGSLTEEIRKRSRLAVEKGRAIEHVMRSISMARYPLWNGPLFQESVYLAKKIEAESFKKAGYPEDAMIDYPYVVQYADLANIPLQQAADEILFKAKLHEDTLVKTEMLRMRYFNKIKNENDPAALKGILNEFVRESYLYATV
jgi:hypothetical protein